MKDIRKVIIVAGGSIDTDFLKEQLKDVSYSFIIAADKGLEALDKAKIKPDLMLGDFDSASEKIIEKYRSLEIPEIKLNPVKDDTDMEFAIRESIRRFEAVPIVLYAASGSRLDHTMANMELLKIGYEKSPYTNITLINKKNRVSLLSKGAHTIVKKEQYGQYISLLCYTDEVKGVTLKGMKYNLNKKNIKKGSSLCISNEILDEVAYVDFDEGMMYLVEALD